MPLAVVVTAAAVVPPHVAIAAAQVAIMTAKAVKEGLVDSVAAEAAAAFVTASSDAASSYDCEAGTAAQVVAAVAAPAAADAAAHVAQAEDSNSRAPGKSPSPPQTRGTAEHVKPRSPILSQLQHRHARSATARSPRAAEPPIQAGNGRNSAANARKGQRYFPQASAPPRPGSNGSLAVACSDAGLGRHRRIQCGYGAVGACRCGADS